MTDELIECIARKLYNTRFPDTWVCGDPWPRLTPDVRAAYLKEAEDTIKIKPGDMLSFGLVAIQKNKLNAVIEDYLQFVGNKGGTHFTQLERVYELIDIINIEK